ncbi:BTAD domain-containing putative transcriptional regulator [Micromonospora sp. MS34]|uniref:AfsR/SARP family transcriptional regulator n=1 Tax=Micromonospora sp. MS34 TaxID=3385971 RepID=UPI0039A12827
MMQLEVRLLGTVELSIDGRMNTPGAAKRRAVLAGLAIEANRPVSVRRLAEMAWAGAPPASAMANLRSHIAALRRQVGDRLIARPNGYELRLSPRELDVTEFQRLAGEGRSSLDAHHPRVAIAQLSDALAQWRGAAGDGLPQGTGLDNHWASLDEQRLQVFEELAQARLALGEHGTLLPELRRHLAAQPLRERAWGQLILALYRCGDVPGALDAYRRVRTTLAHQLGIEPGSELAALHRAVLDRAPALNLSPPAVAANASGPAANRAAGEAGPAVDRRPAAAQWAREFLVPRELPADLVTFVGRTEKIAEVVAGVTAGTQTAVVVSGPVGAGKTALAVRAARTVAADFPDGQIFVDLTYRPAVEPDDVLARVLRSLGVAPADMPVSACERAGRLRSIMDGRRILLVVDGIAKAAQVRPLIPAGPGPALIAVSQRHLHTLDGVRRVTVDTLPEDEGHTLLAVLTGPERLAAAVADTAELVRLCAGSPLALRIAGARLASRPALPVAALVAELEQDRLDWLAHGDISLRDRLDTAYAATCAGDEVAGQVFALLGTLPDMAAALPDQAAAQLGVSRQRVRRALEDLLDAHLVYQDARGRYRLPALVHDYAAELAGPAVVPIHPLARWRVDPVVVQASSRRHGHPR